MTNVNYNKMSQKDNFEPQEILEQIDEIIPPVVEAEPTVEPAQTEGVVSGCDKLYVRAEASTKSEPLGVIKRDDVIVIYESESTEDFYSISTESGLTGFCMKKFISIV